MKAISICGRTLLFDSNFVAYYEAYTCVSLEKMAKGFLCGEYESQDINKVVEDKTDAELIRVITKWAKADLEGMGIPYANNGE